MDHRTDKQRRVVLITGASAGIGAAIAAEYAQRGWDLALTARRAAPMEELAATLHAAHGTEAHIYPMDLFEPDTPAALIDAVRITSGRIDGLVNNAGYGAGGRFTDRPWEDHDKFLRLMLHVPTELTHAVLGPMAEARFGRIINVASVAGYLPGAKGNNMYNAVKSFLIKFSESVHTEMARDGVHVTALCPGFTRTEFHDAAQNFDRSEVDNTVPDWAWLEADVVAKAGVDAAEANQPICIPGTLYKAAAGLGKVLPARIMRSVIDR